MILFISLLTVIFIASCGGEKVTDKDAEPFIFTAKEAVTLLNDKKYDDLRQLFDRELRVTISDVNLQNLEPTLNKSGNFVNIEHTSVEKDKNDYLIILAAKYAKEHRIFTVRFNREVEIIDFLMQ